jgi:hypothetical protein
MTCSTRSIRLLHVLGLLVTPACSDDGGAEETTAGMTSSGTTGSTSTTITGEATTGEATTSSTAGMDSSGPGPTTSETSPTTTGETEGTTTAVGETDGTECFTLDEAECMANPLCMAISGSPILMPAGGACLGPREFLECQPQAGCGDAITYACEAEGSTLYEFLSTCIPTGWAECGPPPPFELMPC